MHVRMNRETNAVPVILYMTMNKKIQPQGLYVVQDEEYIFLFPFLLTCITVNFMIDAFLLIVHFFLKEMK